MILRTNIMLWYWNITVDLHRPMFGYFSQCVIIDCLQFYDKLSIVFLHNNERSPRVKLVYQIVKSIFWNCRDLSIILTNRNTRVVCVNVISLLFLCKPNTVITIWIFVSILCTFSLTSLFWINFVQQASTCF